MFFVLKFLGRLLVFFLLCDNGYYVGVLRVVRIGFGVVIV